MEFKSVEYGVVKVSLFKYHDGDGIAVRLFGEDNMPLAVLSVNLPEYNWCLKENEFFCKTWSENEVLASEALSSGLFVDTGSRIDLGNVVVQVWRIN